MTTSSHGCDNPSDRLKAELAQMHDWIDGKRSWTNLGPHEPYTPDVIAVMDAQEVVKHAAAAQAYASMIGVGLTFAAEEDRLERFGSWTRDQEAEALRRVLVAASGPEAGTADYASAAWGASTALIEMKRLLSVSDAGFTCDTCEDTGSVAQEGQIGVPGSGCRIACPDCRPVPVVVIES